MPRIVRCGVIQATCEWSAEKYSLADIKEKMIAKHEKMIAAAAKKDVQILGLQELFYGPYFCAEQNAKWYELTESVPGGPTLARMQKLAKKYKMVLVVPVYEIEMAGVFFNTAAVFRRRRKLPGEISQASYSALPSRVSGRNFISRRETRDIRCFRRALGKWACTSVTTGIFRRARGFWA